MFVTVKHAVRMTEMKNAYKMLSRKT